ncbi:hypothetical protein [Falsigemmobacter faecalis]|uniref:Uncharacterized protein n=1 Tax=Falsigemmobacter faecalis TaxID=2488730 RepID=A0A3P3DHC1_9RHOB|nr:hypothetical protein [Falsigemmobacter faecalis]RRH71968.1 hypothetical protein EG244_15760 [Falsigemmobacter faecalis]
MTDSELDEIMIFWWPKVLRRAMAGSDEWVKSFARSIAKHGKRAKWHPSEKQAFLMRRLVADLSNAPEPELDLIDREDGAAA